MNYLGPYKIKLSTVLLLMLTLIWACEDSVNLDLPLERQRLVISGWITDREGPYAVSVSRTIGFNDNTTEPGVSGAEVFVTDRLSRRFDFTETSTPGLYESDPGELRGIAGEAYILFVNIGEDEYQSSREVLNPVPDLDTIFFDISFDPNLPIDDPLARLYFLKGSTNDIPNIRNFYRWKMYVNDTLKSRPEEIVIFDDRFTDGNVFETKVPDIQIRFGDKVRLEQWSLTEGAFDYYSFLISQIGEDEIGPSTPPSSVRGNITNVNRPEELVLGYFGASQITERQATVIE